METEPLALDVLYLLLLASVVLCGVLGLALRRASRRRGVAAPANPYQGLLATEADRTRRQHETQLTGMRAERDQALAANQHLHFQLTELRGSMEARIAAEVDGRLAAALEARVEAAVEARVAAVLEARVEAGVAARLAEASAKALGRFAPRGSDQVQEPPGAPPQSPAVPHQLPLGRDCAADSTVDGADLGPLIVRAASVRGPRQREDGEHRRDAVMLGLVAEIPTPTLLSVVAAGAPRGLWSQSAAQRTCRSLAAQVGRYGERLGGVLDRGGDPDPRTATLPTGYAAARDEAEDGELAGLLRAAVRGVGRSVGFVARSEGGATNIGADAAVPETGAEAEVGFMALLSELGDRQRRRHVAFGIGDTRVLRLRNGVWETVFAGVREARLPTGAGELRWARFETRPNDLVAVCTAPVTELLLRDDLGEWFAQRWARGRPHLTEFFSDVNVRVRCSGGDRSVVCLWDFGEARRTPEPA
ncbi:hypothetical protein ABZ876_31735 [Streptomyces sp. NPDC046931]|uniref:hypothetical protein n=1 Tax=Streptomyces sp. NPDC046931 TaxID=3154806 RepID=UPI0033C24A46